MPMYQKGGYGSRGATTGEGKKGPSMKRRPLGGAPKTPVASKPAAPASRPKTVVNDSGMAPSRSTSTPTTARMTSMPGHIASGGDKMGYLGHFRSSENLARGHNVGAPSGRVKPTYDPTINPIAATRQQNRADVAAAKLAGGNVGAVRRQNRADLREAKGVRKARNEMGFKAADTAALKGARMTAREQNQANTQAARGNLATAREGMRSARQALRGAMGGGKKSGLGALV